MTDVIDAPRAALRTVQMPQVRRLAPVQSFNAETRTVRVMWSAGARVLRYDWWEGEYFVEELDMGAEACDLTRLNGGAPVLDSHQRYELDNVVGVVERAWIENGEGYADIRLSARDDLAWLRQDIADGVVRNVSIGYDVSKMDQRGFDPDTGYPLMVVSRWQPFEISLVPVGADAAAGTRSPEPTRTPCEVQMLSKPAARAAQQKESTMDDVKEKAGQPTPADIKLVTDQAREAEIARVRDISAVGEQWNYRDEAAKYVREGKSAGEFRDWVLEQVRAKNAATADQARSIGLTDEEVKRYSINRALAAMFAQKEGKRDAWSAAGFERECHEAVMKTRGVEPQNDGIFVPWDVQARALMPVNIGKMARENPYAVEAFVRALLQRDISVGASGGANLVQTDVLAGSFIELLRSDTVMGELGARMLDGLQGNVSIPRQTAAASATWLANETTSATESQPTVGALSLTPKNVAAYVEISRQLMMQANPAADMMVAEDIRRVLAIAFDTAAYAGSGAGGQPTGLTGTGGVGAVTGTSLAWAGMVEFQTDVGTANALADGCAYLTTPAVAGLLMQRQRFTSTDSPIWQGTVRDGVCAGYRGRASTIVTAASMAFGDWTQVIMAMWGDLEIARNDTAVFPAGIVGIRGFLTCDIGIRQAGAFSVATSIT